MDEKNKQVKGWEWTEGQIDTGTDGWIDGCSCVRKPHAQKCSS